MPHYTCRQGTPRDDATLKFKPGAQLQVLDVYRQLNERVPERKQLPDATDWLSVTVTLHLQAACIRL